MRQPYPGLDSAVRVLRPLAVPPPPSAHLRRCGRPGARGPHAPQRGRAGQGPSRLSVRGLAGDRQDLDGEDPRRLPELRAGADDHPVRRVRVVRLDRRRDIAGVVSRVADVEGIEIGPEAVGLLARHATGSFRDALGTLEQLVAYSGTKIVTDDVLSVLGVADQDLLFGALDAIADGNSREALLSVHRVAESGRDPTSYARDLETHARELLVVQTLGEVPPQVAMTPDHDARLAAQAERVPRDAVVRLLDLLAAAMKAVRDGADARTQLELALVKAASPEIDAGTRALQARIERLEQSLSDGGAAPRPTPAPPVPTPAAAQPSETEPAPAPPAPPPMSADLEGLIAVWPAVLDSIRA